MSELRTGIAIAALSMSALTGCADNNTHETENPRPADVPYGVEEFIISQPPLVEQFTPCELSPRAVYIDIPTDIEVSRMQRRNTISIRYVVGPEDTAEKIASCYFEEANIGMLSLEAANKHLSLDNLKEGEVVDVHLSNAMTFVKTGDLTEAEMANRTGLSLPLVEVIYSDLQTELSDKQYIILPKQEPCSKGRLYHIAQPGESLESISSVYGDVANEIFAFNNILPEKLKPGHILEISNRGYLSPDNFEPPANGFWCK